MDVPTLDHKQDNAATPKRKNGEEVLLPQNMKAAKVDETASPNSHSSEENIYTDSRMSPKTVSLMVRDPFGRLQ